MIFLERNKINNIVVTITSNMLNVSTPLPYFLFEIIEPNTGESIKYFTSDNISISRRRYDEFPLELVDEINEDLPNGKIYLDKGHHSFEYRVYETSVEKSIDPINIVGDIIHSGKLIVDMDSVQTNPLYD